MSERAAEYYAGNGRQVSSDSITTVHGPQHYVNDRVTTWVKESESSTASSRLTSLEGRFSHLVERVAELEKRPDTLRAERDEARDQAETYGNLAYNFAREDEGSPVPSLALWRSEVDRLKAKCAEEKHRADENYRSYVKLEEEYRGQAATIADLREELGVAQSQGKLWENLYYASSEENKKYTEAAQTATCIPEMIASLEVDAKLGALVRQMPRHYILFKSITAPSGFVAEGMGIQILRDTPEQVLEELKERTNV